MHSDSCADHNFYPDASDHISAGKFETKSKKKLLALAYARLCFDLWVIT